MTTTRKQHSPKFEAQVVTEAIRGEKTLSQLGSQFKVSSDPDCEVAQLGPGASVGAIRGRANAAE